MRITLNGQARDVPDGATVAQVLESLGKQRGPVAVEVNREIVPRSEHARRPLADGDAVEIVTLVGGG
jgi:sulfur carrier protein